MMLDATKTMPAPAVTNIESLKASIRQEFSAEAQEESEMDPVEHLAQWVAQRCRLTNDDSFLDLDDGSPADLPSLVLASMNRTDVETIEKVMTRARFLFNISSRRYWPRVRLTLRTYQAPGAR
jgi:hypothetical protein